MPKIGNLASQSLDELGEAAYARDDHEMRNNSVRGPDIESSIPDGMDDEAYEHKPIDRDGHAHATSAGGGRGTKHELRKSGGPLPKKK